MTIREYFGQRKTQGNRVKWIGAIVALVVVVVLMTLKESTVVQYAGGFAVAAITVAAMYTVGWGTKCPRCHGSLGKASRDVIYGKGLTACPHCRVSVDEPATLSWARAESLLLA